MRPRVPFALQQVFLKSSGGEDVQKIKAPKNGLGFRIFKRKAKRTQKKDARPCLKNVVQWESTTTIESASESFRRINPITEEKRKERKPTDTPQGFFEAALEERGYSTEKFVTIESGYYCKPTPLQKASYGTRTNEAILNSDHVLLKRLLDAGLSPNPCNDYGESLVHRICRRGDAKLLKILLEHGCRLQIADDYGRTPLHDAFWKAEPSEEILNLILNQDRDLIRMMDCRGFVPLDYVRKEAYDDMIRYLQDNVLDQYFPHRSVDDEMEPAPELTQKEPHSSPVPDPKMGLLPLTAQLVANGDIEPEDALNWDDDDDSSCDSSDFDSEEDSYYSETEVNEVFDIDLNEAELMELCQRVGPLAIAEHCLGKKSPVTSRSFLRESPLNLSSSNLSVHPEDFLEEA